MEWDSIDLVNKSDINGRLLKQIHLKHFWGKKMRGVFTEDHKLLTEKGWKEVKKLTETDKISTLSWVLLRRHLA